MSSPASVGMALIVRDEADTITRCLASFYDHVDVVAIVDTGSRDDTIARAEAFAASRDGGAKLRVGRFDWCDDFAAARTAADDLLGDCAWRSWIDADDELHGAEHLRAIAARAPRHLAAYVAGYEYAFDDRGVCVCYLKRERLVRAGAGTWTGRVHEAQVIDGATHVVAPELLEWRHRKDAGAGGASNRRNLRILRKWVRDEPTAPRVLSYLGTEELSGGRARQSLRYFRRYLAEPPGWVDERVQVRRRYAIALMACGRLDEAVEQALSGMREQPTWPDSYLTLAEAAYAGGDHAAAAAWARRVLELRQPDTWLIINPLDYSLQPRLILAGALGAAGQPAAALEAIAPAEAIAPGHPEIARVQHLWRAQAKREHVAGVVVELAQVLVAHDEQAAATDLLERAVPYFVRDHPSVVRCRSELRERLLYLADAAAYDRHYVVGGSKPEDFHTDERALQVAGALPRARFLADGLVEQIEEAA